MQIKDLQEIDRALQSSDMFAVDDSNGNTKKAGLDRILANVYSKTQVDAKLSSLTLVKARITGVVVPDGTQTEQAVTVDLSDFVPSGKTIFGMSTVFLGDYSLPYLGVGVTRVEKLSGSTLTIKSTSSAWDGFTLTCVLYLQ